MKDDTEARGHDRSESALRPKLAVLLGAAALAARQIVVVSPIAAISNGAPNV
jgi:hypothetical protein